MFEKNQARPAFAAAGMTGQSASPRAKQRDGFTFNSANTETDDFNAFTSEQTRERAQRRERPAPSGKPSHGSNHSWIIAVVAAVAAILLLVLVASVIANSSKDIEYTDNTYLAFVEDSGSYRVAVNGTVLEETFDGETRVIPSLDRSFAYIECNSTDGYLVYIVKGKNVEAVTTEEAGVTEILGYAESKPGVIYAQEGNVYVYNESIGEDLITKSVDAENFMISGDGSTVIYTLPLEDSATEDRIYLYRDGSAGAIGVKNCTPVQISDGGDYVYAYGYTTNSVRKLYCITTDDGEKYPVSENEFGGITAMNVSGDEILYYTVNESKITAAIFSALKNESYEIAKGKGIFVPATVDPNVARYDSFADTYLQSYSLDIGSLADEGSATVGYTYYVNKKYEAQSIASSLGKFSPDGQYFYYVNSKNTLYQVDLDKTDESPKKIYEDTVDFAVTQKGNVYMLDDQNFLYFYKASTAKKTSISKIATAISMHDYANTLYFITEDENNIYVTEEGSVKEIAKFDTTPLTALPYFTTGNTKKCFAYFYDENAGYSLFYTSNGKNFKLVSSDCEDIVGASESILEDWFDQLPSNDNNSSGAAG